MKSELFVWENEKKRPHTWTPEHIASEADTPADAKLVETVKLGMVTAAKVVTEGVRDPEEVVAQAMEAVEEHIDTEASFHELTKRFTHEVAELLAAEKEPESGGPPEGRKQEGCKTS